MRVVGAAAPGSAALGGAENFPLTPARGRHSAAAAAHDPHGRDRCSSSRRRLSVSPEPEDKALFICTADVPSVVSPATCFATCSCVGTTCAVFCASGKPMTPVVSDCDIISTGIWLSHFVSFFCFNVFSLKCLPNIYSDRYLLSARGCSAALALSAQCSPQGVAALIVICC